MRSLLPSFCTLLRAHRRLLGLALLGIVMTTGTGGASAQAPEQAPAAAVEQVEKDEPAKVTSTPTNPPTPLLPKSLRPRSHRTPRGDLVVIGNDVVVKENETAQQIVVIGGSLSIQGKVTRDVLVVLGKVKLGPKAEVRDGVIVVCGGLDADPGARVGSTQLVIGSAGNQLHHPAWLRWPSQWLNSGLLLARPLPPQYWWSWGSAALVLLVCFGVALLFPRSIQTAVGLLERRPVDAWLTGMLAFMLFVPLLVLLAITVIGLLAIPFAVFAFLVAFLFGKVAVYRFAGHQLGSQFGMTWLQQPLAALLVGAAFFYLLYTIPVLGLLVWLALAPLGFGAVMLALFSRPRTAAGRAEPSPPAAPVTGFGSSAELSLPKAGFWLRFVAFLLDLLIVGLAATTLLRRPRWFLFIWVLYHLLFWTWYGTTIGGTIVRLQLVRLDGRPMNLAVAFVRLLGSFFSAAALGLGFFWAGWSPTKQSWHDKMAGTVMVKLSKTTP